MQDIKKFALDADDVGTCTREVLEATDEVKVVGAISPDKNIWDPERVMEHAKWDRPCTKEDDDRGVHLGPDEVEVFNISARN